MSGVADTSRRFGEGLIMGRRKTAAEIRAGAKPLDVPPNTPSPRILALATIPTDRRRIEDALASHDAELLIVDRIEQAAKLLAESSFDLVLAPILDCESGCTDFERFAAIAGSCACVALCDEVSAGIALRALRAGASDIVCASMTSGEMAQRIRSASDRTRESRRVERERTRKFERLRRFTKTLLQERRELLGQVTDLCASLSAAHEEMASGIQQVALASEFNSIIRQDLNVESLLRTVLEYLLPRIGPTNAAIFLPASSGDFSLGAYVNYDCPKDTAEVLLEHLACSLAPAFEDESDIVMLGSEHELLARLGEGAHWLEDSSLVAFSCRQQDECLAVVALFRDRRTPFGAALMPMLKTVRDLFARQLGRIVHTHHRHIPKHKWGSLGDAGDEPGDIDLAA